MRLGLLLGALGLAGRATAGAVSPDFLISRVDGQPLQSRIDGSALTPRAGILLSRIDQMPISSRIDGTTLMSRTA